jgi:hypothetical protein
MALRSGDNVNAASKAASPAPASELASATEVELSRVLLRIETHGVLEEAHGLGRPMGVEQQHAQVFVRLREGRREIDGAPQVLLALLVPVLLHEEDAEQRAHVDVVGVVLERRAAHGFGLFQPAL